MKLLNIRRVLLIVVTGSAFAGVISSNVGCGDSSNGTAGSGGSSGGGSGGTTGNGGGGGQKPVKLSYTFDTATSSDSTMWKLNDYMDPASPPKNLGWYSKGDAAIASLPTFEWASDDSESSASSGSMKITVTFTDYGQYVDPVINISPTVDLSNSTLALKVRLLSGNFSNGGVQFHFSTTQSYTLRRRPVDGRDDLHEQLVEDHVHRHGDHAAGHGGRALGSVDGHPDRRADHVGHDDRHQHAPDRTAGVRDRHRPGAIKRAARTPLPNPLPASRGEGIGSYFGGGGAAALRAPLMAAAASGLPYFGFSQPKMS